MYNLHTKFFCTSVPADKILVINSNIIIPNLKFCKIECLWIWKWPQNLNTSFPTTWKNRRALICLRPALIALGIVGIVVSTVAVISVALIKYLRNRYLKIKFTTVQIKKFTNCTLKFFCTSRHTEKILIISRSTILPNLKFQIC